MPRKDPNPPNTAVPSPRVDDRCLTIVIVILPVMLIVAWPCFRQTNVIAPIEPIRGFVNPNTASWWELTVLPRVGPTIAHEIVRHRESVGQRFTSHRPIQAFERAGDLLQVRGIGPQTVRRIGWYLRFNDN